MPRKVLIFRPLDRKVTKNEIAQRDSVLGCSLPLFGCPIYVMDVIFLREISMGK